MMEILAQLIFGLLRGILSIFEFLHFLDKKSTENSRLGKSKMQQEHHDSVDSFLHSWFTFGVAMTLLGGGIGYGIYQIVTL